MKKQNEAVKAEVEEKALRRTYWFSLQEVFPKISAAISAVLKNQGEEMILQADAIDNAFPGYTGDY